MNDVKSRLGLLRSKLTYILKPLNRHRLHRIYKPPSGLRKGHINGQTDCPQFFGSDYPERRYATLFYRFKTPH